MKITAIAAAVLLTGCASMQGKSSNWYTINLNDEFTDEKTCIVTTGQTWKSRGKVLQRGGAYYPFVAKNQNGLRVGLKSGDQVLMPVGDVQLRVDKNQAWTITTAETPLKNTPANPMTNAGAHAEAAYKTAINAVARSTSPFTAATGDKAQAILRQMQAGEEIIYRTLGLNAASSTTGNARIDASFHSALADCGITST